MKKMFIAIFSFCFFALSAALYAGSGSCGMSYSDTGSQPAPSEKASPKAKAKSSKAVKKALGKTLAPKADVKTDKAPAVK